MDEMQSLTKKLWPYLFVAVLNCLFLYCGGAIMIVLSAKGLFEGDGLYMLFLTVLFPMVQIVLTAMASWRRERITWQVPVLTGLLCFVLPAIAWYVTAFITGSSFSPYMLVLLVSLAALIGVYSMLIALFFGVMVKKHSEPSAWVCYLAIALISVLLRSMGSFLGTGGMIVCSVLEIIGCVGAEWVLFRIENRSSFAPAVWELLCIAPVLMLYDGLWPDYLYTVIAQSLAVALAMGLAAMLRRWRYSDK